MPGRDGPGDFVEFKDKKTTAGKLLRERIDLVAKKAHRKLTEKVSEYGHSWAVEHDADYYLRRMEEEFFEFRQAVEHDRNEAEALDELCDILNFGLMYVIRSLLDDVLLTEEVDDHD